MVRCWPLRVTCEPVVVMAWLQACTLGSRSSKHAVVVCATVSLLYCSLLRCACTAMVAPHTCSTAGVMDGLLGDRHIMQACPAGVRLPAYVPEGNLGTLTNPGPGTVLPPCPSLSAMAIIDFTQDQHP